MKNKKVVSILIFLILSLGIYSCSRGEAVDPSIDHYTCPMHHQIHMDKPGNCPICGMKLVPVYKQSGDQTSGSEKILATQNAAVTTAKSVEILPEKQALIGMKSGVVAKKNVVKEIRAFGRVAFDPELAVAQKEFVTILNAAPSLKEAARTRLKILGMSEDEIRSLEKSRQVSSNLYLPQSNGHAWVYATVFADDSLIVPGTEVQIVVSGDDQKKISGVVRGVDPIVNAQTRSTRARIEVTSVGVALKPDTYVDVFFEIDLGEKLTVARSAVLDTGTRHLAFVVKNNSHFETREVSVGDVVGDDVIVLSGLAEGEPVATSAAFLIDSETELRGVIAEMTP